MQSSTMVAIDDLMDILPRIGEPLREVEVSFCVIRCVWRGVLVSRGEAQPPLKSKKFVPKVFSFSFVLADLGTPFLAAL